MKRAVKRFVAIHRSIPRFISLCITFFLLELSLALSEEVHQVLHGICGQVIDLERKPLASLHVRLLRDDGIEVQSQNVGYDGKFSVDRLPSGKYLLIIEREGAATVSRGLEIQVYTSPKIIFLEIRLDRDSSVSVRQTITDGSRSESGKLNESRTLVSKKVLKAFQSAGRASEAGDSSKAIEYLQKAIREQPDYFEAFNNLGVQYQKLRQWPEALEAFDHALKLRTDSAKPYINLSLIYIEMGKIDQAIQSLESARLLEPSSVLICSTLGQLYFRKEDYVKAQHYLETTTHLSPSKSREAFLLLIRLALLNKMPQLARQYIQATSQYFPHDPEVAQLEKNVETLTP